MDSMQKFQIDENYPQFYTKTAMDTEFLDRSIRKKICKTEKNCTLWLFTAKSEHLIMRRNSLRKCGAVPKLTPTQEKSMRCARI